MWGDDWRRSWSGHHIDSMDNSRTRAKRDADMNAQPTTDQAADLIRHHFPLARQVAARMKRRYSWVNMDDLYSYSLLGLTKSANAYDPTKGVPFPNFASQKAMFWAIDEMRKDGILKRRSAKAGPTFISMNEPIGSDQMSLELPDGRGGEAEEKIEARDLCGALLERLGEEDRQLLVMYYAEHMTFKEIAAVFEISESSVCLRHKALLKRLRRLARSMDAA